MWFILLVIFAMIIIASVQKTQNKWVTPTTPFNKEWRIILATKVPFYNALTATEKTQFERKIQEFLLNYRITGIQTTVTVEDQLLVASSAIIPVFAWEDWRYTNLFEVLIYPDTFNEKFETTGPDRNILGMVGTGYMNGKMILSKKALHLGFNNETDKKNTAIHEFVHLIDGIDGAIDGMPNALLEKQYTIPWLDLINKKTAEIHYKKSDINPYGATNNQEFFAVTSEYFFERPQLMKQKHPELYQLMESIFNQKMASKNLFSQQKIGRNSSCPCGSGLKFKRCCGKIHYL